MNTDIYLEFFNFAFLVQTKYTILNSLRVVKDVKFYYISSLMEPVVFEKLARLIGQSVSSGSRIMILLFRTSTVGNGGYGCEITLHLYLPLANKAIYRLTKGHFLLHFQILYLSVYIVFWILPLCCVLNYPKRSGPCKVTVGREAKIYISFMVGNSVFLKTASTTSCCQISKGQLRTYLRPFQQFIDYSLRTKARLFINPWVSVGTVNSRILPNVFEIEKKFLKSGIGIWVKGGEVTLCP